MTDRKNLTTNQGVPVGDNQNSMTAGRKGPTLIEDYVLIEKLAHFDRERVPNGLYMLVVLVLTGNLSLRKA